ncbi:unnamed protein product [Dibothriocephalus latus]|uniref:Uncharacterized protein n=1 Tax=Dibothriocephalus latus TaxID=60516 RepID=A0A3P7P816_DIBLA|nr:unnamed protein product [Dibothriocephalus latus]
MGHEKWLCPLLLLFAFTVLVNKFFWIFLITHRAEQVVSIKKNDQPIQDLQGPIEDNAGKITAQLRRQEKPFYEYFHPAMGICDTVTSYGGFMVELKRLLINTTAIEGKLGGEDYESVMFQDEESEYVKLGRNTFAVECAAFHKLDK